MPGEVFDEKNAAGALELYALLTQPGCFDATDPEEQIRVAEIAAAMELITDERRSSPVTDEVVTEAGKIVQKVIPK